MELVLNELSVEDINGNNLQSTMETFINTIKWLNNTCNKPDSIKNKRNDLLLYTHEDFTKEKYPEFFTYIFKLKETELRTRILGILQAKQKIQTDYCEYICLVNQERIAIGLGIAHELQIVSMSLKSNTIWEAAKIPSKKTTLYQTDNEAMFIDTDVEVDNFFDIESAKEIQFSDYAKFWEFESEGKGNKKVKGLFGIEFLPDIHKKISKNIDVSSNTLLLSIPKLKRISELVFKNQNNSWTPLIENEIIPFKHSGESDTTKNNLRLATQRIYTDGYGVSKLYTKHIKHSNGDRIYFDIDYNRKVVIIADICPHKDI